MIDFGVLRDRLQWLKGEDGVVQPLKPNVCWCNCWSPFSPPKATSLLNTTTTAACTESDSATES